MYGFNAVTDSGIDALANLIGNQTHRGRRVFLRYASEMNGNWFKYGQQPTAFKASFIKVVTAVRAKALKDNLAIVWAPNSSNGYPFPRPPNVEKVIPNLDSTSPDFAVLNTNGDKNITQEDDAYSPYYPGDEYVDWVGMSQYHYGDHYDRDLGGWVGNILPKPGQIEHMITGAGGTFGVFNFYRMFSGDGSGGAVKPAVSKGGKPFMITETGATFHISEVNSTKLEDPGVGRVVMKQAWWRQILNETFIKTYPRFKAVNFFEFQKFEEGSTRDFTALGPNPGTVDPFTGKPFANETTAVLNAFLADLPKFGQRIIFANVSSGSNGSLPTGGNSTTGDGMTGTSDAPRSMGGFVYECHLRPHLKPFVDFLFTDFQVGVWTSAGYQNAKALVTNFTELLDIPFEDKLLFMWTQAKSTPAPTEENPYGFVKDLSKIWKDWHIRRQMRVGPHNTIMINDSTSETALQPENALIIPTFSSLSTASTNDHVLLGVQKYLRDLMTAKPRDVRVYLKTNKLSDRSLGAHTCLNNLRQQSTDLAEEDDLLSGFSTLTLNSKEKSSGLPLGSTK
ncbi:hypothetical protein HDV00_006526 [Rhizophlyctis rosea]|nr:hypothetical protein HDV00_006526 [Rhizophlyctis rosea]